MVLSAKLTNNAVASVKLGEEVYLYSFAGMDTTLCSDAVDYLISDALASNPAGVSWKNITTNSISGFGFDVNAVNYL